MKIIISLLNIIIFLKIHTNSLTKKNNYQFFQSKSSIIVEASVDGLISIYLLHNKKFTNFINSKFKLEQQNKLINLIHLTIHQDNKSKLFFVLMESSIGACVGKGVLDDIKILEKQNTKN